MKVEVVTDDANSSAVISDFGRRRGSIQDITTRSNNRVIICLLSLVFFIFTIIEPYFSFLGSKCTSSFSKFTGVFKRP